MPDLLATLVDSLISLAKTIVDQDSPISLAKTTVDQDSPISPAKTTAVLVTIVGQVKMLKMLKILRTGKCHPPFRETGLVLTTQGKGLRVFREADIIRTIVFLRLTIF